MTHAYLRERIRHRDVIKLSTMGVQLISDSQALGHMCEHEADLQLVSSLPTETRLVGITDVCLCTYTAPSRHL